MAENETAASQAPADTKKNRRKVLLAFGGARINDKIMQDRWFDIDDLPNDGEKFPERFSDEHGRRARCYKKMKGVHAIIGDVFEFDEDADEPGTIFTSTGQRHGRWNNAEDVASWRAFDIAAKAEMDSRKKSKHDDLMEQLEPFRAAYRSLGPGVGRSQFLAKIVAKIVT